ncbi:MAG TPA: hypothetical protein PLB05_09210 [Candidatus Omnitrophota bacterium]|nr:hypothetical protein [Candidatus Omnitrophota bacterium]
MRGKAVLGRFLFFSTVLILPGCAKLAHLEQLLTLQAYSNNNEDKEMFIEKADKRFEALVHDLTSGRFTRTMRQKEIRKIYGAPIYEQALAGEPGGRTLWMYRRQADYAGKEKIYLYFDARGSLLKWEHELSSSPDKV